MALTAVPAAALMVSEVEKAMLAIEEEAEAEVDTYIVAFDTALLVLLVVVSTVPLVVSPVLDAVVAPIVVEAGGHWGL